MSQLSPDDLDRLEALVARLEAVAVRLEASDDGPITSWREAAEVLGVHPNTLARRRQERGDTSKPWFASGDDLRRWWGALLSGRTSRPTRATRPAKPATSTAAGPTLAELRKRRKG